MSGSCMKAFQCSVETALPERAIFTCHFTQTCQIQYDQIMDLLIGIKKDKFSIFVFFPFLFKMLLWL